jgi:hypothetical protein
MRTAVARSLAVLAGTGLACAGVLAVGAFTSSGPASLVYGLFIHEVWPRTEKRLADEGPQRSERIDEELRSLDAHPWAGVYHTRGLPADTLRLAPDEGFTWFHGDVCGNCTGYRALGEIRGGDDRRLTLDADLEHESTELDGALFLVPWGDLLFAVPDSQRELFCSQVLDGVSFPSAPFRLVREVPGFDARDPERPAGRPELPAEFLPLVPDRTISGAVLALLEWAPREPWHAELPAWADATYLVGLGAEDGLAVGMRLFVEAGGTARVTEVGERESRIRLVVRVDERSYAESLPGTRVTTARSPRLP